MSLGQENRVLNKIKNTLLLKGGTGRENGEEI